MLPISFSELIRENYDCYCFYTLNSGMYRRFLAEGKVEDRKEPSVFLILAI